MVSSEITSCLIACSNEHVCRKKAVPTLHEQCAHFVAAAASRARIGDITVWQDRCSFACKLANHSAAATGEMDCPLKWKQSTSRTGWVQAGSGYLGSRKSRGRLVVRQDFRLSVFEPRPRENNPPTFLASASNGRTSACTAPTSTSVFHVFLPATAAGRLDSERAKCWKSRRSFYNHDHRNSVRSLRKPLVTAEAAEGIEFLSSMWRISAPPCLNPNPDFSARGPCRRPSAQPIFAAIATQWFQ